MEEMKELFGAYAENDLSDRQARTLCDLLRSSDGHVDWFVRECYLHWQLTVLMRERLLHAGVMESPAADGSAASRPPIRQPNLKAEPAPPAGARRGNRRAMLALAASLAVAVAGLTWAFSRPRTVGQLTQATADVRWSTPADAPAVGALLHAGRELHLDRGRALVTLVSGAQVVFEGPAVVRFAGNNKLWLKAGRLSAKVPPQATGFTVDTPAGQFIDLGTEFTLDYQPGRSARLYVFTGLVDVQPARGPSFKVPQDSAREYNELTGEAKPLEFGPEQLLSL